MSMPQSSGERVSSDTAPALAEANFSEELCAQAALLLEKAIDNGDAYLINGMLVLKLVREQEAFNLGLPFDATKADASYYGLRVGLCVQDAPPFKRGEWYTVRGEETRAAILTESETGRRSINVPIRNQDWRIVSRVVDSNKSPHTLKVATAYAKHIT